MYEKGLRLLRLVRMLQRDPRGLGYAELSNQLEVPRRTVERMLQTLRDDPQCDVRVFDSGNRERGYRFSLSREEQPLPLSKLRAEELAALRNAADFLRRKGVTAQARHIENLHMKLLGALDAPGQRRMDRNADDLANAEAFVLHPGPREKINPEVVQKLHKAILNWLEVRLRYRSRRSGKTRTLTVQPYGFLHGRRRYLVARHPRSDAHAYRNFLLANITRATLLKNRVFNHDEDFDLQNYAAQSFGAFHEEPSDVVWRFSKAAAEDARNWLFHPTQQMEERRDGKLVVRFRASGLTEMAWHLFTWGSEVEVLAPKKLRDELARWKKL